MRMWMVNPKFMCRKHLLGEHNEIGMFAGSLRKKIRIDGYIRNNLLEPTSLLQRHNQLADEMIQRGYNHNSPMYNIDYDKLISYLPYEHRIYIVNSDKSMLDLFHRCEECKKRFLEFMKPSTSSS